MPPSTLSPPPSPLAPPPSPEPRHRRNGFVARLPKSTRDQVNQLLLDGVPYSEILLRLGDLLAGITEDHLSTWRAGGYMDWLRQQQHVDTLHASHEMALDLLRDNPGTTLQDASRQVVAAQLCQVLLDFDPACLADQLRDKPKLYMRVINALARLTEGELACGNQRLHEALLKTKLAKDAAPDSSKVITDESLNQAQQKLRLH